MIDFVKGISKIYTRDLENTLVREIDEKGFLQHEDFDSAVERAEAIMAHANDKAKIVLALAIAKHREEFHNEDTVAEQEILSANLSKEEIEFAVKSWWKN